MLYSIIFLNYQVGEIGQQGSCTCLYVDNLDLIPGSTSLRMIALRVSLEPRLGVSMEQNWMGPQNKKSNKNKNNFWQVILHWRYHMHTYSKMIFGDEGL